MTARRQPLFVTSIALNPLLSCASWRQLKETGQQSSKGPDTELSGDPPRGEDSMNSQANHEHDDGLIEDYAMYITSSADTTPPAKHRVAGISADRKCRCRYT